MTLTFRRKVVLMSRLMWIVIRALASELKFGLACLVMGTSRKEVRRQLRLYQLTGRFPETK